MMISDDDFRSLFDHDLTMMISDDDDFR